MKFLKVCFSLCHSFRSTGQYERVKGLTRYLQVIHQSSWCQQGVDHPFMNAIIESRLGSIEPRLGIIESPLGIIEPRLGIIELLMGRVEAHLGIIKPLLGKVELCFGTVEPVKGLTKLYFENVSRRARKSAVVKLRMPLSNGPSEKTVAYYYKQNNFKSSSALEKVSVHSTKSTDLGILLSSQRSDTCRHSKTAETINDVETESHLEY